MNIEKLVDAGILSKINPELYYCENHNKIEGKSPRLSGDCSGLYGNCSGLSGNCTKRPSTPIPECRPR